MVFPLDNNLLQEYQTGEYLVDSDTLRSLRDSMRILHGAESIDPNDYLITNEDSEVTGLHSASDQVPILAEGKPRALGESLTNKDVLQSEDGRIVFDLPIRTISRQEMFMATYVFRRLR